MACTAPSTRLGQAPPAQHCPHHEPGIQHGAMVAAWDGPSWCCGSPGLHGSRGGGSWVCSAEHSTSRREHQHAGHQCCLPPGHQARRRRRTPPCSSQAPSAAEQQAAALHSGPGRRAGASKAAGELVWASCRLRCSGRGRRADNSASVHRSAERALCHSSLSILPHPQEPDEALHSIDQGPGKASPSFQDMRNAQASWAGTIGP